MAQGRRIQSQMILIGRWMALATALASCSSGGGGSGTGRDAAGVDGGGGGDASAAIDSPDDSGVVAFCRSLQSATCDRAFACVPAAMQDATFTANYGPSLAACQSHVDASCSAAAALCSPFDSTKSGPCLTAFTAATCARLVPSGADLVTPPADCLSACP
jgi:hypothetical protein